jgi:hypothetical protein
MPIHFRCCFCGQLLGIARRKAGTVIDCPTCRGKVWVPSLDGSPPPPESPPPAAASPADADVEPVTAPPSDGLSLTPTRLFLLGLGLILTLALVAGLVVLLLRLLW